MRELILFGAIALVTFDKQSDDPAQNGVDTAGPRVSSGTKTITGVDRIRYEKRALETMLRSGTSAKDDFNESFERTVGVDRVNAILSKLHNELGNFDRIEAQGDHFVAYFVNGTDAIYIHVDDAGKIDGLLFKEASRSATSLREALGRLVPTHGEIAYLITRDGSDVEQFEAQTPLAVASGFKLAVLARLQNDVQEGRARWDDVYLLRERWKSLPSGVLQTWPDAIPISLATYAADMISISDNTAADALIDIGGHMANSNYAGANTPFLTTRQAFELRSTKNKQYLKKYRSTTVPARRAQILQAIDKLPLPQAQDLSGEPMLDVEWRYSVRDLCGFVNQVSDLPIVSINPGLADPDAFSYVAFKGGSDTGVLSLTTLVVTKTGSRICFSATLNDLRSVDNEAFSTAYREVLAVLSRR